MSTKPKSILTCSVIALVFIFIYAPLRTGKLEQQFIKSLVSYTDKIVISIGAFEKSKRLKDKDLSKFYTIIKQKYTNMALIAIADKNNKILKAGKDERFITSNKTFDSIIDSFIRNEYKATKGNDFIIRYYDQSRYYLFVREITDGKILVIFPYRLSTRLIIQLILEVLLIVILSIIITAVIFIYKNRRYKDFIEKSFTSIQAGEKTQEETIRKHDKKISKKKLEGIEIDSLDLSDNSLNDHVYELFKYISREYKPQGISLYSIDEASSRLNKMYEVKGNAFVKTDNGRSDPVDMKGEIIEELRNSSIMLLDKGKKVSIPILYGNTLMGVIEITRDRQFKGPEISDIKSHLKEIGQLLREYNASKD